MNRRLHLPLPVLLVVRGLAHYAVANAFIYAFARWRRPRVCPPR
jgi:hypothetical protein